MKPFNLLLTACVGLAVAEIVPEDFQLLASNQNGEMVAKIIRQAVNTLPDPWAFPFTPIIFPINIEKPFVLQGSLTIADIQIKGHQGLDITEAVVTVLPIGGNFNFRVPKIVVSGDYKIEGVIELDSMSTSAPLPINGDGPFSLELSDIRLNTHLMLFSQDLIHLKLVQLIYDLEIHEILIKIEGLFKELDPTGELNEAVNVALNSYLPTLFKTLEVDAHNSIITYISNEVNNVLETITIRELIELIIGDGDEPEETTTSDLPDESTEPEDPETSSSTDVPEEPESTPGSTLVEEKTSSTTDVPEELKSTTGSSLNPTVNVGLAFVLIAAAFKMLNL